MTKNRFGLTEEDLKHMRQVYAFRASEEQNYLDIEQNKEILERLDKQEPCVPVSELKKAIDECEEHVLQWVNGSATLPVKASFNTLRIRFSLLDKNKKKAVGLK